MSFQKCIYAALLCMMAGVAMVCDTGCANIIPPTGGPRDSLPPVLVEATPKDSALRFNGKKIVLTFDEYVQLDNPSENIIVSPTLNRNAQFDPKLRTVNYTHNRYA